MSGWAGGSFEKPLSLLLWRDVTTWGGGTGGAGGCILRPPAKTVGNVPDGRICVEEEVKVYEIYVSFFLFFIFFFFFLEKTLIEGRDIRFLRVYLCYWISVQALCARRCFFYLNVLKSFKTWTFKGIFISYIWISFRFHLNFLLLKILFSIRYTKYLFFQILDLTKFLHSKQAWLHFCTSFINNKIMQ